MSKNIKSHSRKSTCGFLKNEQYKEVYILIV